MSSKHKDVLIEVRLSPEDQKRAAHIMAQEEGIDTFEEALLWCLQHAGQRTLGFGWHDWREQSKPTYRFRNTSDDEIAGRFQTEPRPSYEVKLESMADRTKTSR